MMTQVRRAFVAFFRWYLLKDLNYIIQQLQRLIVDDNSSNRKNLSIIISLCAIDYLIFRKVFYFLLFDRYAIQEKDNTFFGLFVELHKVVQY